MLLEKIKEALSSLYEDIEETPEAEDTPGSTEVESAVEEAAVAETQAEQEENMPTDTEEAAEAEAEPEPPPGPRETDYKAKGFHLDVELPVDKVVAAAEILDRENFFLEAVTGVDWIDDKQLEVVYDYNNFTELCRVVVRARTDRSNPEIPTISHIYPGANWHERETHDFFGIVFTGHPNLEPLLLPEDADFHPLLKDFKA